MHARRTSFIATIALYGVSFFLFPFALTIGSASADISEDENLLRVVGPAGPATLDPHVASDAFTVAVLANFFEPLLKRDPDLNLRSALATDWEQVAPRQWRFHLREGVRFHDGQPFGAEDVVHSFNRSIDESARLSTRMAGIERVEQVDPLTVDFHTSEPMPLLPGQLDAWLIVSRNTSDAPEFTESLSADFVNGTGPFELTEYESDVALAAVSNRDWWREPTHNLDAVAYEVAGSAPARVATALGGDADIVLSVPVQDVTAIAEAPGVEVLAVDEPRAIFLGLAQRRPDGSETPLADARVRQAVYNAVDVDTLISVILRGQGVPLAAPVARQVTGYPQSLERRPHDPERARHLLRQAGYASGVTVPLDCPNDRYINDEAICTAIAGMLERVGFDIRLRVEPGGPFTNRLFQQGESDPGIYLIGWLPSSLDSGRVLADLVAGADPARRLGVVNITGNEDTDLDALIETIQRETDMVARSEMMIDAWHRVHERTVYVPLYQQQSAWAVRSGVTVVRRADGILLWNGVRLPDGGG